MEYCTLGGDGDLTVSAIGYGCQSIGGGIHHSDDTTAIRALQHALNCGITFFDTADHYSLGHSERLVGRAFAGNRDAVIIATKVGTQYTRVGEAALRLRSTLRPARRWLGRFKPLLNKWRAGQRAYNYSGEYLQHAVNASLRRLRTDRIDLLQLHKPPTHVLRQGTFVPAIEQLKAEGKVRCVGIACDSEEDTMLAMEIPGIVAIQVTLNLLQPENDALARAAAAKGCPVIARNPLAQGYLAGDVRTLLGEEYATDRSAARKLEQQAQLFSFLECPGRTRVQAALLYARALPGVRIVLPRLLTVEQVNEVAAAPEATPLSAEELCAIEEIRNGRLTPIRRYAYRAGRGM